jgi:mannan endo-1,4-beta-mannosidase
MRRERVGARTRSAAKRAARTRSLVATAMLAALGACTPPAPRASSPAPQRGGPIDPRATAETRALFHNLRGLAARHVLFGHQDDLAYGYRWTAEPGRSDVLESSGSYPAVYGWEVAGLETASPKNIDGVNFERMRGWIAEGYRRGGVITISWHVNNPLTGGNAWDTTSAVATILPGGARHEQFKTSLDRLAQFLGSLRGPGRSTGTATTPIPVIFRPWHELTGGWFWWGVPHTKGDEFARLWRFTVQYLRDVKGLHHLLYAYSPNAIGPSGVGTYLDGYPGDEWVDVLGYDRYLDGQLSTEQLAGFTRELAWVVTQAEARHKIPALTETGQNALRDSTWWTGQLARAIAGDAVSRRIAYVLVWRNAYRATRTDDHFYAPYRGQPSERDFRRFKADPLFMFEDELPDLYRDRATR